MLSKKSKTLVGLDVEAGSIAAAQVAHNGATTLVSGGTAPLGPDVFHEGEVSDPDAFAKAARELFAQHKLARRVRIGIANQKVAVRMLRLPAIENRDALENAIRFQAQDHIPMPLDQAVLDYHVVGRVNGDAGAQMDIIMVAARREMVAGVLDALRRAGLRAAGIDLAAFGMIRALANGGQAWREGGSVDGREPAASEGGDRAPGAGFEAASTPGPDTDWTPATLYCNLGDVTNLAVARGPNCLFTRVSSFGMEGVAQRLAERRELTLDHARQWLAHVGLERPLEAIEGDRETVGEAREVLAEGATKLVDELRLSLEFYGAQEGAVAVDGVVAAGPGTTIPGLLARLERDLGRRIQPGHPQPLAHLDPKLAARLTVAFGLALEE